MSVASLTSHSARVAPSTSLNRDQRKRDLAWLSSNGVDVLVVGGGITGAGAALDAAARGYSVALVEQGDFASGTSSKSSRLVHGGIRYLARGELGIAWESARERHLLMTTIAPHLTRSLPFIWPLTRDLRSASGMALAAILRGADILRRRARTPRRLLPPARRLSHAATREFIPGLRPAGLRGGLLYWDGQLENDARLAIAVARTAVSFGAHVVPFCRVEQITDTTVRCRDIDSGDTVDVTTSVSINATGVWAADLTDEVSLEPSRGAHLVTKSVGLTGQRAVLQVPIVTERQRAAFAVPADGGRAVIGLTDQRIHAELPAQPTAAEVEYLLTAINRPLSRPIANRDVIGGYTGLRPLVRRTHGHTADLSRRHAVIEEPERRLVTIIGGKLTTYRAMAEDAVNAAARIGRLKERPCSTRRLPLVGADRPPTARATTSRLARRYGSEASRLLEAEDALRPVVDELPVLRGEVQFAFEHEGAMRAEDVVDRRLHLGSVPAERSALLAAIGEMRG